MDKIHLTILILTIVDIIGFSIRVVLDQEYNNYHLKRIPFMWFYYSSKIK